MSSMNLAEQMEHIYRDLPADEIPWNLEQPPDVLVELIESGRVPPCRAIDLGCGAGNYAVWLATRGFHVTGLDLSPAAVESARKLAAKAGVSCEFVVGDLLGDVAALEASFDFAYDWEVLHHIFPDQRRRYVANVRRMLRLGARYLSVCFSEEDTSFGGGGKYRTTPLGTKSVLLLGGGTPGSVRGLLQHRRTLHGRSCGQARIARGDQGPSHDAGPGPASPSRESSWARACSRPLTTP